MGHIPTDMSMMLDWCVSNSDDVDVRLARTERNAVVGEPLFFCPDSASVAADNNLGVATIAKRVSAAQIAGFVNRSDRLGRNAIDNVLNCRPTTLARVVNTLNVINYTLIEDRAAAPVLRSTSIIAAVFRIADFNEIKRSTGVADAELAERASIAPVLVESLTRNYRLHFDATLKIFEALRTHPKVADSSWGPRLQCERLRGNIVVDATPYTNVMKVGEDVRGNHPVYALNADNLRPAPVEGHDWAIGGIEAPSSDGDGPFPAPPSFRAKTTA